jgi:SAM-dependent methyltransferase
MSTKTTGSDALNKTLCFSSRFAMAWAGHKPVVFEFCAPHRSFCISNELRVLLSCFPCNGHVLVEDAINRFVRISDGQAPDMEKIYNVLGVMIEAGVLTENSNPHEVYTPEMVQNYSRSRQVPPEICRAIVADSLHAAQKRVLDIGTGTGSLAVQIAKNSSAMITSIDISDTFLEVARQKARGLPINFVKCNANELVFYGSTYDVAIASQSFHWLDAAWAARGICLALEAGGAFFAIESKPVLPAGHPLNVALGFGTLDHASVFAECLRHTEAYAGLFAALPILGSKLVLTGSWIFRQARPFDVHFARSYFPAQTLKTPMPRSEERSLEEALQDSPSENLAGHFYWLLVKFVKIDLQQRFEDFRPNPQQVVEIPFSSEGD